MQPLEFELAEPSKNKVEPEIYEDRSSFVYGCLFCTLIAIVLAGFFFDWGKDLWIFLILFVLLSVLIKNYYNNKK